MIPKETRTIARWGIVVATAVIVIPLLISALLSWLHSGTLRVTTTADLTVKSTRYCQVTCNSTTNNPITLASGNYMIDVELSDGTIFSTSVTIKGGGAETAVRAESQVRIPLISAIF